MWGEAAAARAERTTTAQRAAGAILGIIAVGAFIVAAILWNIPLLPVL